MWIKFIKDAGAHTVGQKIDKEDVAAQTLIECKIAEACEGPKAEPAEAAKEMLGDVIKAEVAAGFKDLRKELEPSIKRFNHAGMADSGYELGTAGTFKLPATVKRTGRLKNFEGPNAEEQAYRFGMWLLSNYASNDIRDPERKAHMQQYVGRCKSLGVPMIYAGKLTDADNISTKASNELTNSSSGYLVPEEFGNVVVDLREKYGKFRQNTRIVPMGSDTRSDPRRKGGTTAYFVGEDVAGTQSTKTWDRVGLTAKKLMILSKYSNELNEDAVLNIADDLAYEIAYSFALKEDQCAFLGDGTSTYGRIQGICPALKAVDATVANVLGLTVATGTGYGTSYGSIVLGDFNKVVATLPEFADGPGAKWYCSKFFWGGTMQRLQAAAGGNTIAALQEGALKKSFLGYDVEVCQVMPKVSAINQVCAVFGNLALGSRLGDRRQITISLSDVALNAFEQDEMAIRGTQRFDIVVHDVGESSAGTAKDTQQGLLAGPIVGLITAAS